MDCVDACQCLCDRPVRPARREERIAEVPDEGIDQYLRLMVANLLLWPNQNISLAIWITRDWPMLPTTRFAILMRHPLFNCDNRLRSPYERIGFA
jgi:hypothetical protein